MGAMKTSLILAGALAAGLTLPAAAADLLPPLPEMPGPVAPIAEVGTGWYLRGDIGYVDYAKPDEAPFNAATVPPLDNLALENTWSVGVGVGYKLNAWLRADVTADYRTTAGFRAFSSGTGYTGGYSVDHADLESTTILANGYLDLGTFYGFTPYVGAGVGVAVNQFSNYNWQVYLLPGPTAGAAGTIPGDTRTNFAWALMAGTAVEMGRGLALDVGYRYVNLGSVQTKRDAALIGTKLKDLDAHEVRVGLRWMFGQPVVESGPISRAF